MTCFYDSVRNKRSSNEDSFAKMEFRLNHEAGVYAMAVADGMGGLAAGKDYSNMAVRLWYRELLKLIMGDEFAGGTLENQTELLREFSGKVYGRLGRILYRKGIDTGIRGGTTLTTVIRFWDTLIIANVGDSPVYGIRDGDITLLSEIQNVSGKMVREGKTEPRSLLYYQNKNRLLQYLGSREEVHPHCVTLDVRDVDALLLGTDGAFGDLTMEEIHDTVCLEPDPRTVIRSLFEHAREYGEEDNQTAILYLPHAGERTTAKTRDHGYPRFMDEVPAVPEEGLLPEEGPEGEEEAGFSEDNVEPGGDAEPFPIPEITVISQTTIKQGRRGLRMMRRILARLPFSRR